MPIITISRGSYYRGKEVAEKVAERLGWACVSRDDLLERSGVFQAEELRLARDITDAIHVLDRFACGKERFVENIRAVLLDTFRKDNIVYHGLAGHHILGRVPHQLKVRIIADFENRAAAEASRTGISAGEARDLLRRDDEERRRWSRFLYGVDTHNPEEYDLVVNIGSITVDDAVEIIAGTVALPRFAATEASRAQVTDMALAARAKVALFKYPNASITAREGKVRVAMKAPSEQEAEISPMVREALAGIEGVGGVEIRFVPYY